MTADELASVTLEYWRAIRAKQAEPDERLNRIEIHLSAIEQTLGSLYARSGSDRENLQRLTRRVERIERRPDLAEPPH